MLEIKGARTDIFTDVTTAFRCVVGDFKTTQADVETSIRVNGVEFKLTATLDSRFSDMIRVGVSDNEGEFYYYMVTPEIEDVDDLANCVLDVSGTE